MTRMLRSSRSIVSCAYAFLATSALLLAAGCHRAAPPALPANAATNALRIVSLAPSLTEIVCAVGGADRLVGRTDVCNHPSNLVAVVPIVGSFGRPHLEPLLAQRPTLVLDVDLEDKTMGPTLDRLGIGHRHIPCQHLADIPVAIHVIGRLVERAEAGDVLARSIDLRVRNRLAAVASVPLEERPLVYVEIWGDPLMTAGRTSFIAELVRLAGGRNLGDELANDYGTISSEWVLRRNPEVILCLYPGPEHQARTRVAARLGWQTTRAVQSGRVYGDFDLDTILRPGPRVLDGVEQLRRAIAGGGSTNAPPAGN